MGKIIGIDLGTTNSCVSVIEGVEPVVVQNSEGQRTTPSIVAFTDKGRLVGQPAKNQMVTNPERTVYSIKRFMGRRFGEVPEERDQMVTYRLTESGDDVRVNIDDKQYSPPEVSAVVLQKMKETVERYLGETVTEAVISVPAYFNDSQRQATKDAGRIAGLEIKRIIGEPTAAALAYGLNKEGFEERIAVYDLGGGHFNISILELGDGVFEVKSTNGDMYVGGDNFDQRVIDWLIASFENDNGIDLSRDRMALQRLKEAAEKAKIELSGTQSTEINLPFITEDSSGPKSLQYTLSRARFEQMIEDLVQQTRHPCEQAMKDAGVEAGAIDQVILVGGSTRIPAVQQLVAELFGKDPNRGVNPDEAVAVGAAIQGGILGGEVKDVLILDVTPLSLGIETVPVGGSGEEPFPLGLPAEANRGVPLQQVFTPLIEHNTTIPTRKSQIFSTAADNQTAVSIHVLQGEREMARQNRTLGGFDLIGIPAAPRGVPQIEVTFDIDANGIVHVSAKDLGTGKEQTVRMESSSGLSEDEVERMVKDAAIHADEDKSAREAANARNEADSLIYATEKSLDDFGANVGADDKDEITAAIAELKQAVEGNDSATIKEKTEALKQASHKLTEKVYKAPQQKAGSGSVQETDYEVGDDDSEGAVGHDGRDAMSRRAKNDGADLESALQECRQAARDGSKIAQESLRSTKEAFDRVTIDLVQSAREVGLLEREVFEKFQQFGSDLDAWQKESRERLEEARRGMDDFSIALFGRTMAGKSTLMEILTDGNGASIGKGAQRTTRDVRSYRWRGLKVTDVPGISAFEGAEDERLAFDAAKNADLVLFLITDDAPQAAEAECFAQVRALGKPLIGICNVKSAIEDDDDLRLFLHAPERCFDMSRLKQIERQFRELAAKLNAGAPVSFVFTHLLARFLARRPTHRRHCKDLQLASRFSMVERRIVDTIVRRGTFLRTKRFIDLAGNPSGQMSNKLLDFSARNADDGRVFLGKKREMDTWFSTSRTDWQNRVEVFIGKIADDLRSEIPGFVEDHYQNPTVSWAWKTVVTRHNIKRSAWRFQEILYEECSVKLAEHARQLKREMQLVDDFAHDLRISLNPISDSKRAWNWSTTVVSGLLLLGAFAVPVLRPVLRLVEAGVGVLSRLLGGFFEDREEKASRQREELSKTLHADVERIDRELRTYLYGWLNKSVVEPVKDHVKGLHKAAYSKFILANAQRKLAWTLNRERKKLHRRLLRKALQQLEDGQYIDLIRDLARVPGTAMMLVVDPGTRFPDPIRRKLQDILTEKIWFVVNTNQKSIVRQALRLGCDSREIDIEERIGVVHVPVAELDASGRARVDLTQQLTELHVMKSIPRTGRL